MSWNETPSTEAARVGDVELAIEDHGPMLLVTFSYESGGAQGLGYVVDMPFVTRFMRACGVYKLRDCNGRVVKVTHTRTTIQRIEPMSWDAGRAEPFDVTAWCGGTTATLGAPLVTPADLERVRVALRDHENHGGERWAGADYALCICDWRGERCEGSDECYDAWIEHVIAVLAAQGEETE